MKLDAKSLAGGVVAGLAAGAGIAAAALVASDNWPGQGAGPGSNAAQVAPAPGAPSSFADIVEQVAPAVVSVHSLAVAPHGGAAPPGLPFPPERGPGPPGAAVMSGSGFLISPDGFLVTNNHVVAGARQIRVTTKDDRQFPARIVGRDEATDLAVLKIEGRNLPHVSFSEEATPRVGDWVIAVGSPFGLGGTATAGIVSAYAREIGEAYVSYIQIDAPINQGNSGGPTFDVQGRVIGVNTAIFSPSGGSVGIGFAIPSDVAQRVTRELIEKGRVTRGYLGATVQDLTPELAQELGLRPTEGALVAQVAAGGPAAAAGVRPGDVVVGLNGEPITDATELTRLIGQARAGQSLRLSIVREGQRLTLTARAGVRPSEQELARLPLQGGLAE